VVIEPVDSEMFEMNLMMVGLANSALFEMNLMVVEPVDSGCL
jgi:hypothetical protein